MPLSARPRCSRACGATDGGETDGPTCRRVDASRPTRERIASITCLQSIRYSQAGSVSPKRQGSYGYDGAIRPDGTYGQDPSVTARPDLYIGRMRKPFPAFFRGIRGFRRKSWHSPANRGTIAILGAGESRVGQPCVASRLNLRLRAPRVLKHTRISGEATESPARGLHDPVVGGQHRPFRDFGRGLRHGFHHNVLPSEPIAGAPTVPVMELAVVASKFFACR